MSRFDSDGKVLAAGCLTAIVVVAVFLVLGPFITMWAWNEFMPYMFDLDTIDWWKALALNLLLASIGRVNYNGSSKS